MAGIEKTVESSYLDEAAGVIRAAKVVAARSVNLAMVYAYFEVGRIIVEEEQGGRTRAGYGQQVLAQVSKRLTEEFGKGYSTDNLKLMRRFYLVYSQDTPIGETVFPQFAYLPATTSGRKFFLSWSHYIKLMRIEEEGKRHFYEIEAARNNWSLKELQRQFNSALYERLALSRDKEGVRRLAEEGYEVESPSDIVRDPYVLEFLGLDENADLYRDGAGIAHH